MPPRYAGSQLRFGPELTPMVRILLITNVAIFVAQFLGRLVLKNNALEMIFALQPEAVLKGYIWQLVTYSFLHGDIMHLLMNMLTLWMFGSEIEGQYGQKPFLKFYLFCAFMGGLVTLLVSSLGFPQGIVIGASGATFGLLAAFALLWPNREIIFMLIFPLKAKYFVMILMLMIVFSQGGHIAHMAHLGGIVGAVIFIKLYHGWKSDSKVGGWSLSRYLQKRRFQRYQKEMNSREDAKTRVDQLLEKISKDGMNSLSRSEKKFLNEASKKYFNE
jgi:membrane associated rhomboid family serine protease